MGNFGAPVALNQSKTSTGIIVGWAANAADLEAQLRVVLPGLRAANLEIKNINIEGAGDGSAFVITFLIKIQGVGANNPTRVYCYEASSPSELKVAAQNAVTRAVADGASHIDMVGLCGAKQGRHWLGCLFGT